MKIWTCKIGGVYEGDLPDGADAPMRRAVEKAYREITGVDADFNFSGWGGELSASEAVVAKRHLT